MSALSAYAAGWQPLRHKFRNVYRFELEPEKLNAIEKKFSFALEKFRTDLAIFLSWGRHVRLAYR